MQRHNAFYSVDPPEETAPIRLSPAEEELSLQHDRWGVVRAEQLATALHDPQDGGGKHRDRLYPEMQLDVAAEELCWEDEPVDEGTLCTLMSRLQVTLDPCHNLEPLVKRKPFLVCCKGLCHLCFDDSLVGNCNCGAVQPRIVGDRQNTASGWDV